MKMVIFHSYVSLPEGMSSTWREPEWNHGCFFTLGELPKLISPSGFLRNANLAGSKYQWKPSGHHGTTIQAYPYWSPSYRWVGLKYVLNDPVTRGGTIHHLSWFPFSMISMSDWIIIPTIGENTLRKNCSKPPARTCCGTGLSDLSGRPRDPQLLPQVFVGLGQIDSAMIAEILEKKMLPTGNNRAYCRNDDYCREKGKGVDSHLHGALS